MKTKREGLVCSAYEKSKDEAEITPGAACLIMGGRLLNHKYR